MVPRLGGVRRCGSPRALDRKEGYGVVLELILLILLGLFTLAVMTVVAIGAWSIVRNRLGTADDETTDQG